MKYLKRFESLNYEYDWCRPESEFREYLTDSIEDILIVLKDSDSEYTHHIGGWTNGEPYVWISGKLIHPGSFGRNRINKSEIKSIINDIEAFLKSEDFKTKVVYLPNDDNIKQIYIHFRPTNPLS